MLPGIYHWLLHLGANAALLVVPIFLSWVLLGKLSIAEVAWLVVLMTAWSFVEYSLHRFVLHGPRFYKSELYRQHSILHHSYFDHRHMVLESAIDLNRILLFTSHLFPLVALIWALSTGLYLFAGARMGLLFLLSGSGYTLIYETANAIAHLKPFSNTRGLRWMVQHHQMHHHPSHAARANFSVVVPFWDSVFGTRVRG
jgi:sterol desaturase/sphingolipid hydroxylase (fatty acid hydroxylase superfamily)